MNRQVIDIRTSAGVGDISNEILRRWSDKGYDQAVKEGNYDRSRERLNFEIAKGGKVVPVDKDRPLDKRMAEMLASRGIKDPYEVHQPLPIDEVLNIMDSDAYMRILYYTHPNPKAIKTKFGQRACTYFMPEEQRNIKMNFSTDEKGLVKSILVTVYGSIDIMYQVLSPNVWARRTICSP